MRDNFIYDEENYKIINKKINESYTMGSTLKVIVICSFFFNFYFELLLYVKNKEEIQEEPEEGETII